MRGWDARSDVLFSYVNCEARVPKDHPLRAILRIVDAALTVLSPEFEGLYAKFGRPSIPPERLLRALLLQAFYSVRSEKQLMEQLQYNLLFRWFVGLSLDDEIWDETVFTKNRERLIEGDIAKKFMAAVLDQEAVKALLSDEHFSVDGTLIEAWAGMKSFRPKDASGEPPAPGRNGERDFHGEKRSNETHASTTDLDARLYRKGPGQPAHLRAYLNRLPDFDDVKAEEKALDYAQRSRNLLQALSFLVSWPALNRAANLMLQRSDELDGDHYEILTPAAEALAGNHPLAATLVLRAMIDFSLKNNRSSRYRHAARHLLDCSSLVSAIEDFGRFEPHEVYEARLRREHRRKSSFWSLVD